jgi:integrase
VGGFEITTIVSESHLPSRARLNSRHIGSLQPGQVIWDSVVNGFGARRQAGPVSFILRYRTVDGRQRTFTIGKDGSPWSPATARNEALRLLGEIVGGGDPSGVKQARRGRITVGGLCDQYLADAETGQLLTRRRNTKRPSTLVSDRGRITRHIKPLLGHLPVAAVGRTDVETMMHHIAAGSTAAKTKTKPRGLSVVRGGRGVASRPVGLLGAIFTYAIRKGLCADNPAHGVMRYADGRRDRRLTDDEYHKLDTGLRLVEMGGMWAPAIAATRMMILTGWRRGEVLGLRWSEVDLARRTARLSDTKTGSSMRPLPKAVCDLIRVQNRSDDLVFPTTSGSGPMVGYRKLSLKIVRLAELPADVTPHVLRHSFASLAADLGFSESVIAGLLGHKLHSITSRYVHSADAALLAAADAVAMETLRLMATNNGIEDQPQPASSRDATAALAQPTLSVQ